MVHAVSQPTGIWLDRLNVGSGFTVLRDHQAPNLKRVFGQISARIKALFGAESPALVCEPGRAMMAFRDLGRPQDYKSWRAGHKLTDPVADYTVFGPACDSIN